MRVFLRTLVLKLQPGVQTFQPMDEKQMNHQGKERTSIKRGERNGWRVSCNASVKISSKEPGVRCVSTRNEELTEMQNEDRQTKQEHGQVDTICKMGSVPSRRRRESG